MFLSFIVPVHNTEKYLEECLDSLLCQDIPAKDYEIICIDDGSTDSSPDILDRYGREHTNLSVFHQKNSGVCSARNAGLRSARGEYIWYLDDDDFIQSNCLAHIRQTLRECKCDRLVIDHYECESRVELTESDRKHSKSDTAEDMQEQALRRANFGGGLNIRQVAEPIEERFNGLSHRTHECGHGISTG